LIAQGHRARENRNCICRFRFAEPTVRVTSSSSFAAAISLAILAVTSSPMIVSAAPADVQPTDAQYFIDFRSRAGFVFGHTYIVYGRLNTRGQPVDARYAGIYPLDDGPGLVFGSMIPVAASVRGLAEDRKAAPTSVYRRYITATQYARLSAAVRRVGATEHPWHLLFYNCNNFAIEVAQWLGLRAPSAMLVPRAFIHELRALNER
jgi:hypothetical protein